MEGRGRGIFQGVAEAVCQILVDWAPLHKSRTLPGPVKGRIFFLRMRILLSVKGESNRTHLGDEMS